jgi:hypothetical protein
MQISPHFIRRIANFAVENFNHALIFTTTNESKTTFLDDLSNGACHSIIGKEGTHTG